MAGGAAHGDEVVLDTERLLLRYGGWARPPSNVRYGLNRDPRVPPHRRIDVDGDPTIADFEKAIRANQPSSVRLLAVLRKAVGDASGTCGLIDSGHGAHEPELAFEFLADGRWSTQRAAPAAAVLTGVCRMAGMRGARRLPD